ncbi:MAG TPA: PAS domain S-box protein [Burkholderiaceae bacterium]|nr:PAS domain S-box protein [Burkholderiaceae bacterium]
MASRPPASDAPLSDVRQRAEARLTERVQPVVDTGDPAWSERVVHELGVHQIELEMQNEELRATQAQLQASRDRYADLYELAPVAFVTLGVDGAIVELNRQAIELLQVNRASALRTRLQDYISGEDRAPYRSRMEQLARSEGPQSVEVRLGRNGAKPLWVAMHMTLLSSPVSGTQFRIGLLDIDERVRSQQGATRLAALVASSEDAIVGRDREGLVTSWNDAAARLFGHSAEAMLGQPLDAIVPPAQREEHAAQESYLASGKRIQSLDTVRRHADGTLVPVSISLSPIRDARGHLAGSALIARDISQRQRADLALRQRLRQLDVLSQAGQALIMGAPDAALRRWLFEEVALAAGCDLQLDYGIDPAGGALVLLSAAGLTSQQQREVAASVGEDTLCGIAADQRKPVVLNDFQQSELPQSSWLRAAGARCFAAFPLVAQGRLHGVAAFASLTLDRLRDGDLQVVRTVCDQVSAMLERARLLQELHDSAAALRRADRAKDDFIATLAHELRNPLAPIRNAVGIMRHGDQANPQQLAWCRDIIERQVVQMTRLLEDLLDVSRVTRNKIELRRERLDLMRAVEQAIEATRPLIESREQRLVLERLADKPVVLYGDLTRLTQVFVNLLQNAAKYTDVGGQITLSVSATDGHARVGVRDNGIGIEAQHLPRVFDMFSQLAPALERSGGGLGIGLALTRGLVELHGGRIDAFSAGVGRGSEFVVQLPVAPRREPADARRTQATDAQASLPARRLLVVDDNSDAAQTLTTLLAMHGQDARAAFNAEDALRIAQEWPPDVAVLDIGLPDLDGYELCRRMRAQAGERQPVLIACTGWGQREDVQRAHEAGFDFHLVKPVDPDAVLHLLSQPRAAYAPPR